MTKHDIKHVWVMLAGLLAFTEEQRGDDKVEALLLAQRMRKNSRQRKKFDAYMRDPANLSKIIARQYQAAEMLGMTGETRH